MIRSWYPPAATGLLEPEAKEALTEELLPLASLSTPNLPETEALTGISCHLKGAGEKAAEALFEKSRNPVLGKGRPPGGLRRRPALDGKGPQMVRGKADSHRKQPRDRLHPLVGHRLLPALGLSLEEAVKEAKDYLTGLLPPVLIWEGAGARWITASGSALSLKKEGSRNGHLWRDKSPVAAPAGAKAPGAHDSQRSLRRPLRRRPWRRREHVPLWRAPPQRPPRSPPTPTRWRQTWDSPPLKKRRPFGLPDRRRREKGFPRFLIPWERAPPPTGRELSEAFLRSPGRAS